MGTSRKLLLLSIVILMTAFFMFDLQQFFTLEALKKQQLVIQEYYAAHTPLTIVIYMLIYILVTALSLPGAAILTLAGGAVFGLLWGTVIVSFASTLGATGAFLAARFLFRETIKNRFPQKLKTIDAGISKDGAFYLFSLRLVPVVPFFMINLLMGLTTIKTKTFYWVSQIGMLAGTIVYVNAGTQLAKIKSLSGILSPALLGAFVLLALFPLVARCIVDAIKAAKVYQGWKKPKYFDNNIIVIGAGSGGLVASYIAAAVKAKVTLIEKHQMGGDCLNTGCVPSKALIKSAAIIASSKQAEDFGLKKIEVEFEFKDVMQRIQEVVNNIAPHDSIARYSELGVNVITGEAKIISPWQVEIKTRHDTQRLTSRNIVIAAGAKPFIPPIKGLNKISYLTSDNVWQLREKPKRLLVLGGGPIGCELAQSFARLNIEVTQVEMLPRLLIREDEEVSQVLLEKFTQEGIKVLLEHTAKEFTVMKNNKVLLAEHHGEEVSIVFDEVLLAIGRAANVKGYGLEELGVELSARNTLKIDDFQATNFPNIYACGDVCGPYQFTHTASHQAWYASVNALFGSFKKFRTDYRVIPWATFTDPEIARVGLNEQDAKEQGITYEVCHYDIGNLDRAITDSHANGFVKVLTAKGSDKILGVTIVSAQAGELIAEFVLAMKHNIGLNKILGTIHIYPTMAEANKYVAGVWKREHAPKILLDCLKRFHAWRLH